VRSDIHASSGAVCPRTRAVVSENSIMVETARSCLEFHFAENRAIRLLKPTNAGQAPMTAYLGCAGLSHGRSVAGTTNGYWCVPSGQAMIYS
jgi:hypothetical protein